MKFIRRAKVFSDCWIQDEKYGRIPQEVGILRKLDHPNIVTVITVFLTRNVPTQINTAIQLVCQMSSLAPLL